MNRLLGASLWSVLSRPNLGPYVQSEGLIEASALDLVVSALFDGLEGVGFRAVSNAVEERVDW